MQIVDDINLKYGVMHRDMAAPNLGFCSGHEAITPVYFDNGVIGVLPAFPSFKSASDVDGVTSRYTNS